VLPPSSVEAAEEANRIAAAAAKQAAEATAEANRINREAYLADQRPWLRIDAVVAGPITWKADSVNMRFVFGLENVGRTPALNARIDVELLLEPGDMRLDQEQRRIADKARSLPPHMGFTIFPGRRLEFSYGLAAGPAELAAAAAGMGGSDLLMPHVLGCASYYHSASPELSHQTGFIYEVVWRRPQEGVRLIARSDGDIPADQLGLREWPRPGRID
jgi:hypothetical protein